MIFNFIKITAFLGIALALFVPVSYVLRPAIDDRKQAFAGFYGEPKDSLDLVFIGSSSVYPYYALPYLWKQYGYTGGELSSSIQRPDNIPYLIREALKTQQPKLLVIETRMFYRSREVFTEEEANFFNHVTVDNMKYSINRTKLILETYPHQSVSDHIDLIRYHGNWKDFSIEDLRYTDYKLHDPYKGFYFDATVDPQKEPVRYDESVEKQTLWDYRIDQMNAIIDECEEAGVTPLFVLSPYYIDPEDQEMSDTMAAVIEARGYHYLDFNHFYEETGIDFATDFYNDGHANISGAVKTTDYLGKYIRENYSFVPEHTAVVSAAWEQDYALWNAEYERCMQTWKENAERDGRTE